MIDEGASDADLKDAIDAAESQHIRYAAKFSFRRASPIRWDSKSSKGT